jgi:hypothetical protein
MNPENFFGELKRGNVIRMAGLYLVGAWLVVQVAGTVLPMFGAPEWLPRTIVILLVIGFVPAVIFSWVFELTPEGLKREEDVARGQSITPRTGRRMDRMIIVVLVLGSWFKVPRRFSRQKWHNLPRPPIDRKPDFWESGFYEDNP